MLCPVCASPLIVVERSGIEVDYCIRCHGLWFDAGEIELLASKLGLAEPDMKLRKAETTEAVRLCPRCDAKMGKVEVEGRAIVTLDACTRGHGFWFDRGELGALFETGQRQDASVRHAVVTFLGEVLGR
ncbi:MAG: zf-TFIIB domain-containing protein [Thermoanaerobaculia bacterium]